MTNSNGSTSPPAQPDAEVVAKANELYWHSEESVNRIARTLDLSKGMLYEAIGTLAAGIECPRRCGAELVWPNRTARDRGFVCCERCDFEDEEDQVRTLLELQQDLEETELAADSRRAATEQGAAWQDRKRVTLNDPSRLRIETLLAVAGLAGLAAGLVLGGLFRRR